MELKGNSYVSVVKTCFLHEENSPIRTLQFMSVLIMLIDADREDKVDAVLIIIHLINV